MVELGKNERIDYMYSDNLKIIQDKTAFSFSLDTLLLAYWAKQAIHNRDKVADLCAGNCAATIYMAYFMMRLKFKMKFFLKLSAQ